MGQAKRTTVLTENINFESGGGTRIDAETYDVMKAAILEALPASDEGISLKELDKRVHDRLKVGLPGGRKIKWHLIVVKLDLEKRGLIERIPKSSPQRLRRR
jgi:hypothetical protein